MSSPLPPNSTRRVFLEYTSVGIRHTMILRLPLTGADPAVYAAAYAAIFATRMCPTDSFSAARFSTAGSDFSLPLTFTPVNGTLPSGAPTWPQDPESTQLSFCYRGLTTGRKGRIEFFTSITTASWPLKNRYNSGDSAPIDTLRINFENAAIAGGTAPLVTIGGDFVYSYNYVNIRANSYWQTAQR